MSINRKQGRPPRQGKSPPRRRRRTESRRDQPDGARAAGAAKRGENMIQQKEHAHVTRAEKHAHAAKEREKEVAGKQRVLVAEDNEDTRRTLKNMLELALDVAVDTVSDGSQALEALLERPYSVVITDLK